MLVQRKLSPLAFHQHSVFSCTSCWTEAILEEGGGGGGCPFSPADVSLLVQTAAEMNQEFKSRRVVVFFIVVVLLLFYSGGVVVIL